MSKAAYQLSIESAYLKRARKTKNQRTMICIFIIKIF